MDWLTNYINIYYMLTFMATSYFILKNVKVLHGTKEMKPLIAPAWSVLIIGAITGVAWGLIDDSCDAKIIITTFATGTSLYELLIRAILKKFNL